MSVLIAALLAGLFTQGVAERIYQRVVFQGGRALTWRKALKRER